MDTCINHTTTTRAQTRTVNSTTLAYVALAVLAVFGAYNFALHQPAAQPVLLAPLQFPAGA